MAKPIKKTFLFNLVLIFLLCLIFYWLFFASLGWVTGHGKELKVPNLQGQSVNDAIAQLENLGFSIEIDSTFEPTAKGLEVLEQQPDAGSIVKKGRTIFLTVNKLSSPEIDMPNLVNLSFRSAKMLLENNKLLVGDTSLVPDLANGAVLKQLYLGKEILPGTPIPQGSSIDLVIGDGLGSKVFPVPDIVGLSYPEAVAILNGSNLNFTVIFDGIITDTMTAVVYDQAPMAYDGLNTPQKIAEGDVVDFRVKQHAD